MTGGNRAQVRSSLYIMKIDSWSTCSMCETKLYSIQRLRTQLTIHIFEVFKFAFGLEALTIFERTLSHSPSEYNLSIDPLCSLPKSIPHLERACSNCVCFREGYIRFSHAQSTSDGLLFFWTSDPSSVHSGGI